MNAKPLLVGIAGATCSGKTTLERNLQRILGDQISVLPFDDMVYSLDELDEEVVEDWEQPRLYRWEEYERYLRQLKLGRSVVVTANSWQSYQEGIFERELKPAPIVLSVGFLVLHKSEVRDLFGLKIFVDIPDSTIAQRRQERDGSTDRLGSDFDLSGYIEKFILPAHHKYVEPQRRFADVVVDGLGSEEYIAQQVHTVIQDHRTN